MTNTKLFLMTLLICFLAVLLETTVINFPFVFLLASIILLLVKRFPAYIAAFLLGFFIDSLRVANFGFTPIFIFTTSIFILLYERFSGSKDIVVASVIIAAMAFAYSYVLSYSMYLLVAFMLIILSGSFAVNQLKKRGIVAL